MSVIFPIALVSGTFLVCIDTKAIAFIVLPLTIVHVSIDVGELALSVCTIIFPLALVPSTIGPLLDTEAVPEATNPLSFVGGARLELVDGASLTPSMGVVEAILGDSLFGLVNCKVAGVRLNR